ncbi:hypothetical protein HMPREF9413_0124 [Paenibacillus sp. HGF7]|nr:hypothetical protein HMPREF9413_0124 [Paenibacillus sp. HGF7]
MIYRVKIRIQLSLSFSSESILWHVLDVSHQRVRICSFSYLNNQTRIRDIN